MKIAVHWNCFLLWFCFDNVHDVGSTCNHSSRQCCCFSLSLSLAPCLSVLFSLFLYWLFRVVKPGSVCSLSLSHTRTLPLSPFLLSTWMFRTFLHWGKIHFQSLHFIVGSNNLLARLLSPHVDLSSKGDFSFFPFYFLVGLFDSLQVSYIQAVKAELATSVFNHSVAGAAAHV